MDTTLTSTAVETILAASDKEYHDCCLEMWLRGLRKHPRMPETLGYVGGEMPGSWIPLCDTKDTVQATDVRFQPDSKVMSDGRYIQ